MQAYPNEAILFAQKLKRLTILSGQAQQIELAVLAHLELRKRQALPWSMSKMFGPDHKAPGQPAPELLPFLPSRCREGTVAGGALC